MEEAFLDNIFHMCASVNGKQLYLEVAASEEKAILFHDKSFKRQVAWCELNCSRDTLEIVFDDMTYCTAGSKLHGVLIDRISKLSEIDIVQLIQWTRHICDLQTVPLVVQKTLN